MKKVTFHCDGPDPMKEFIDDPTLPAPLLTQKEAQALLTVLGEGPLREGCLVPPVQALADGRTACVRVMSEDECRAAFIAHYGEDYVPMYGTCEWLAWLACARACGAVKEGT